MTNAEIAAISKEIWEASQKLLGIIESKVPDGEDREEAISCISAGVIRANMGLGWEEPDA